MSTGTVRSLILAMGVLTALTAQADLKDLLEMSERLDKIEKQDFGEAIDKANACTRARDFSCTTSWLQKAGKLAGSARDKQTLAAAEQNMTNEKARIAEEARQRAEEQRRIAEAEERLRVAEAEAARRAQSSGPSTTMQLLQMGAAVAGAVANERARMAASAASRPSAGLPLADLSAERRAIEKARADAAAAQRAREQAAATRTAPAPTTVTRSPATAPTVVAAAPPTTYYSATSTSCPPGMTSVPTASGTACVASGTSNPASAPSKPQAAPAPVAPSAQNAAARGTTTAAGTPNPAYANLDRPPSAPQPKKLYPLVRNYTFDTYAHSEEQGCAEANRKVDAQYARNDDRVTLLTRANCSCTREKDVYGSIFLCKVPVTDRLMVDYDPSVPSSNSSR